MLMRQEAEYAFLSQSVILYCEFAILPIVLSIFYQQICRQTNLWTVNSWADQLTKFFDEKFVGYHCSSVISGRIHYLYTVNIRRVRDRLSVQI